ncbi:tetratricopeptide repeat protein [Paenibacillus turpanensis]|uniref:tetratricopeptide repeat protein n=1 Tax=Paenibacillus turpanensis TaxID=2689078 RepID=UPI001407C5E1|nr:hypothetical protein [Paenibacillus turpanensis]
MIKQLFATMHDALDQIIEEYPKADGEKKQELEDQLDVLKSMSDTFIEQWLLFEEKMGQLHQGTHHAQSAAGLKEVSVEGQDGADHYQKGQGYFKLLMFEQAVKEFEQVVAGQPEFLPARLYLALGYMKLSEYAEASRHLQFIIPMSEDKRLKAVAFNAMGCIHFVQRNLEQATEYFENARSLDPTFQDPIRNLELCTQMAAGIPEGELGIGLIP